MYLYGLILFDFYICVCLGVCAHVSVSVQSLEEGIWSPGARIRGCCELLSLDATAK